MRHQLAEISDLYLWLVHRRFSCLLTQPVCHPKTALAEALRAWRKPKTTDGCGFADGVLA